MFEYSSLHVASESICREFGEILLSTVCDNRGGWGWAYFLIGFNLLHLPRHPGSPIGP